MQEVVPQNRPPLPPSLMREVRQRCGFGCVLCGFLIFEYDHILGWANVRRHVSSEITLLCSNHHRAKTAGFLPNYCVIKANENPWNRQAGVTKPYELCYSGNEFIVNIGTYEFQAAASGSRTIAQAIRIDDQPLIWVVLEDGHILLNLYVYDSHDRLVLQISDNELILNIHSWDIELVGTRLIIREGSRNILFDVIFEPPSKILIKRGRFLRNGVEVLVTPRWIALLNDCGIVRNVIVKNCNVGLAIGEDANGPPAGLRIPDVVREGWDRAAAIQWVRATAASFASTETVINELIAAKTLD